MPIIETATTTQQTEDLHERYHSVSFDLGFWAGVHSKVEAGVRVVQGTTPPLPKDGLHHWVRYLKNHWPCYYSSHWVEHWILCYVVTMLIVMTVVVTLQRCEV